MGIRGLTSYIYQNPEFLKSFKLRDTMLIIDGNCVMTQLYFSVGCASCFGGEYAKYAYNISCFFECLLACNITPVVILDGCMEDRKMNTLINRKLQNLLDLRRSDRIEKELFPCLAKYVFLHIVRQYKVKLIQTVFEADNHIAAVARILNRPVLSNDSDFFVFDVIYIPFETLSFSLECHDEKPFLDCKIFNRQKFFQDFSTTNKDILLPLAATILGNDYIHFSVFKKFFCSIKVSKAIAKKYERNLLHLRIVALLKWIQKYTLDDAVSAIISKLDSNKQFYILKNIETVINEYLTYSPKIVTQILSLIGYSKEEILILLKDIPNEQHKFPSFNDNDIIESECDDDQVYVNLTWKTNNISNCQEYDTVEPEIENKLEEVIPSWFIDRFMKCDFPPYFLDLIHRQHLLMSTQMEDLSEPPCCHISLKVLQLIFRLLSNGTTNATFFKYSCRGNNNIDIKTYQVDNTNYELHFEVPLLDDLKDISLLEKKQMILNTFEIKEHLLENFPPAWRLYIISIKYWKDFAEKSFSTNYHLYSLLLLIVFYVIRRIMSNKWYTYDGIDDKQIDVDMPLKVAIYKITEQDCAQAYTFFESKMFIHKETFDIQIVHAFTLFQNCLRGIIDLNSLLDYPFSIIDIAEFFNGSLIYNILWDLRCHEKLNGHIWEIFQKSPSVLQLFVSMSTEMKKFLKK